MTDEQFREIVIQYEKLVFTVCYQLVRDYHESQNLTQETFLAAYRHIDTYEGDNYKPWLVRIASNKAKDFLKSAYARKVSLDFDDAAEQMVDQRAGPEEIFEQQEAREFVQGTIDKLKEPYRQVISLYLLQEKTPQEIADILDRPVKTVQTQIYRGRFLLKERMQKTVGKESG